jgi:hypothetical protein
MAELQLVPPPTMTPERTAKAAARCCRLRENRDNDPGSQSTTSIARLSDARSVSAPF